MARKIEITEKQALQFNAMRATLHRIAGIGKAGRYMTPAQIRRDAEKNHGLDFEEEIEMVYENIQAEARAASSGIKSIIIEKPASLHAVTGSDGNL
jgi:hypothetical protein